MSAFMDRVGNTIPGVVLRCFSWNLFHHWYVASKASGLVHKKEKTKRSVRNVTVTTYQW